MKMEVIHQQLVWKNITNHSDDNNNEHHDNSDDKNDGTQE